MFAQIERPAHAPPTSRILRADFGAEYVANGFVGWLFAATAPVAVILSVGKAGGSSEAQLASWLFGVFFVNGLITIGLSWLHRQPLSRFWTSPGAVLVGPALTHLRFAEVAGAFYATGGSCPPPPQVSSVLQSVDDGSGSVQNMAESVLRELKRRKAIDEHTR